jgi:hypothetical protein
MAIWLVCGVDKTFLTFLRRQVSLITDCRLRVYYDHTPFQVDFGAPACLRAANGDPNEINCPKVNTDESQSA